MLNPAPSIARSAVTTLATGRGLETVGSGREMRGRTSVLSTVIAGIANRLLSGEQQTLSGDGGFGGGHGLDVQFDAGRLADEQAAGLERHVPGEPEVFAVDFGRGAESDAFVAER